MRSPLLWLLLPAALSSCTLARPATSHTLTLTTGQSGTLGTQVVTLVRLQDSRCRPDVQCIWAGELEATVKVRQGNRTETLALKWPADRSSAFAGLRIVNATFSQPVKVTFSDRAE